jgi:hypothetical protein
MENKFQIELEQLINKHSVESESNTPDFILAEYLGNCLNIFNIAIMRRESWYGRNSSSKKVATAEDEAIMLEKAAYDHNYNNYCARLTLGIRPAMTPYELLDYDFGRVRSASEREAIKRILEERNANYDTSNNAYNDWEITLVKTNGCLCGHNGKTITYGSSIETVKVRDKFYGIGQRVNDDGVIEKFAIVACGRVNVTVKYNLNCPFKYYRKTFDIVNL